MFNWFKKKDKQEDKQEEYVEYEEVIPEEVTDITFDDDDDREFDPQSFGNGALQTIDHSMEIFNSVTSSVKECVLASQNVKMEIARMEHDLDKFIVQSDNQLEKFKSALPVLDAQLTRVSERIDRITDRMLDHDMDASSPNSIQKHQVMLETLNSASDSFNNLLSKLISL